MVAGVPMARRFRLGKADILGQHREIQRCRAPSKARSRIEHARALRSATALGSAPNSRDV
jgi:hypothetical protein